MFKFAVAGAGRRRSLLLVAALTVLCALLAGLWLGGATASPRARAASVSNVKVTKLDAIDANSAGECATQGQWLDVPGVTKTFTLAGTQVDRSSRRSRAISLQTELTSPSDCSWTARSREQVPTSPGPAMGAMFRSSVHSS